MITAVTPIIIITLFMSYLLTSKDLDGLLPYTGTIFQ